MRLTRSMTKMPNIISLESNSNNNKRPSSPNPSQDGVCLTNHAAKRTRTQQQVQSEHPTPTINNNNNNNHLPASHPSSAYDQVLKITTPPPHLVYHEDGQQHSFDDDNLVLDEHDDVPCNRASQGTLTPITNDSQGRDYVISTPPTHIYEEQDFSAQSRSPSCSPPPLVIRNQSDGLRYDVSNLGLGVDDNDGQGNASQDDDEVHYSAFGWPSMDAPAVTADDDDDDDDVFHTNEPSWRSSNYVNEDNNSNMSFLSDQPLQRSLIQDFLQVDDYNSSNVQLLDDDEQIMMTAQPAPTDELDQFFSASQADYASMSFSTKLSIQQQKQQFLALRRPKYITSWPHFLTLEYFDKHDAQDRSDILPSPSGSPSNDDDNDDNQQDDDTSNNLSTPLSSASYFDTKFSVLGRIGSGEYADVWKVWNTESNEVFAVKKLKIPFQSFGDRWLQLVEVRNMMMVQQSPFCLNLYNAWEQDGFLYLQTDFAVATLADYLQQEQSPFPESMAWKIIYEISTGLQAIHHAGVVHMDLKPSNIMIDANGTLRIGDFGTSIRRPLDVYEFKGEGDRHYMAPELLREEYDIPADVFSLGLIIFEMMTQVQLPSTGDSWEMLRLGDFSNYKQQLGDVPLEIRRVLLMMLKSSSESRATIDDILALPHLQRIADGTSDQQPGALYDYVQLIQEDQLE